jgi:UDP-3-O-[3-hydroxymyristoyl] N-acetylglucosamine deacetylase/3-hydroxyacyl-[acyl-carrier-protein] dehydratase
MVEPKNQRTLASEIKLEGKGLHTGYDVKLTIKPAEENFGVKFKRTDIEGQPVFDATIDHVIDTTRGTTIGIDGVRISTIEHVLSSLSGFCIDNALIEVNAPEMPIMDGSARYFTEAIAKTGTVEQHAERNYYVIKEKIHYHDEENGIDLLAFPDDHFSISALVDYPSDTLKNQYAELNDIQDFPSEIASCRTFSFFHELEKLLKNNLIKGGDLNNAIIIIDKEVEQAEIDRMAQIMNVPTMKVKKGQMLCNPDLYFSNEPARHKILDIVGDISLVGRPLVGKIFAKRPGHKANTEFAKLIKKSMKRETGKDYPPRYNINQEPILNTNQIKKILPHRPPFLLVDKILSMDEKSIVGLKNVTLNEGFFVGHFPDEPIMPGVLQIESMAQVGGILALNTVPDPENYLTYFLKIEQAKFKKKVVPGDTLIFKLELANPIRRGLVHMVGKGYVGDTVVFEAEMKAQITKVK